jgi:hypothetical protein
MTHEALKLMDGPYNSCERCGSTRHAPWEAVPCHFNIGGFKRVYHLCESCRENIAAIVDREVMSIRCREG